MLTDVITEEASDVTKSRRSSGLIVVLAVAAVLLIGGGIGGYAYWQSYKGSPEYSIKMLNKCVTTGNWDGFRKYVDIEAVVKKSADSAVTKVTSREKGVLQGLVTSLAKAMRPQLATGMMNGIRAIVETKRGAAINHPLAFLLTPTGEVIEAGNLSYVTYHVGSRAIKLTLKDRGDYWQVTEIEGFAGTMIALAASGSNGVSLDTIKVFTDKQVVEAFKKVGIPIGKVVHYTDASDPNGLIGRPGQYIQKANWVDTRLEQFDPADPVGGTVEVFDSLESMQKRKVYLESIPKSGLFGLGQYIYAAGNVIVRIEFDLTPAQAKQYETTLQSLIGNSSQK